jgi:hypothetical protein
MLTVCNKCELYTDNIFINLEIIYVPGFVNQIYNYRRDWTLRRLAQKSPYEKLTTEGPIGVEMPVKNILKFLLQIFKILVYSHAIG